MLENIYQIPHEESLAVDWQGYDLQYDLQLYELGQGHSEFFVINPNNDIPKKWKTDLKYYVEELPDTRKCIVVAHEGEWIAKIFKDGWYPYHGYETVEIVKTKLAWTRNSAIDKLITYEDDPFGTFEPNKWDRNYKLVWYIDPRFNPLDDKVWAFSCQPIGKEILGTKDMGYVVPDVLVQFNEHLPDLGVDANDCCPPFYDLAHECAYELDPIHQTNNERLWVIKFTPMWRRPKEWKWLGTITPEFTVIYNPELPKLDYDLDYLIPWHDFDYEHVWMLDRKHFKEGEEDIWAFTIQVTEELEGSKIVDYISPNVNITYNSDLPKLEYNEEYIVPWHDLAYEHVWYLATNKTTEKVWAVRASMCNTPIGEKEVGTVVPLFEDHLDVVFISYKEPNADENWNRVLEKAPWAKRVHGVDGIFNAHKAAAKLAKTDMFFVVDGDAWLVDDWQFDFQPGIFDRDCAYVWCSQNPVNDLTYQNGGVKLFNKSILMKQRKWTTLDMFTGIMPKISAEDKISCVTTFNVDEFSTWRSAFRECVKLYKNNQMGKLNEWLSSDPEKKFGKYAALGASQACDYASEFANDHTALLKINDYNWLRQQFDLLNKGKNNE
jgi:hypothetical protein